MERLASGSTGSDACKQESAADTEDDTQGEELSFLEPESVLESALLQDQPASKGKVFQQPVNTSQPGKLLLLLLLLLLILFLLLLILL